MDWFPIALLCAFSLASADAFTKKYLADYRGRDLVLIRFGVPALLLMPLLWVEPLPPVPPAFWGWVGMLVPLELLGMLLYVKALQASPLHLSVPYLAFTPVFNILTGWLILGEQVSPGGAAGIVLVVLGTYLLNIGSVAAGGWRAPFRAVLDEPGSRLMLAVAAIYSVTSVMGKAAMAYATPTSFGAFYYVLIGGTVLIAFAVTRPRRLYAVIRRPAPTLLIGIMMGVMIVTHFLAIARVEVAYMISVKRTALLFGILYGALLFGERRLGLHLVAGGIMVAGVALILI